MKLIIYFINTVALIAAINWLLIGTMRIDIVSFLFGQMNTVSKTAYIILGLASLIQLFISFLRSVRHKK